MARARNEVVCGFFVIAERSEAIHAFLWLRPWIASLRSQ